MIKVLPISKVRSSLPELIENAATLWQRTLVTVGGQDKAVLMSVKELELLETTLEILSDPETMEKIEKGKRDVDNNNLVNWQELKQELGL
jgi:PHD/YefM family antitoxin component YafN of YafNO toxin-antitoxin module